MFMTLPYASKFLTQNHDPPIISITSCTTHLLFSCLSLLIHRHICLIQSFPPPGKKPILRPKQTRNVVSNLCKHFFNKMFCSVFFLPLRVLVLLLFILSFFSSASPDKIFQASDSNMDPLELETLFKVMETVSSDQNWRTSHPNPCKTGSSWVGIECKSSGNDNLIHVSRLDFGVPPNPSCKNTATFPSEIFQLPRLESVFFISCFTHTRTTISFPLKVLSPSLQQLSIRSNPALVGLIPFQLSSLKSLQILTLSQNLLSGSIPAQIFSLSFLLHLDLSYNVLTGRIPFQVGNLKNLVGLDLSYNKLAGTIPITVGQLGMLQKLDLSSNKLTGRIPETIGNLHSLVFIALSSNELKGFLPKGVSMLQNLQYFIMDDNPVFVSLPSEFGELQKLQELRLANSGYSGKIPPTYSKLSNLSTLSLQNNRLTGEIPASFGSLSHIYHLNLSRNFLDGVVPFNSSFLKRLGKNLDISGNPGLCLSPSEANGFNLGVNVCGSNKSGSSIIPWAKSEAHQHVIPRPLFFLLVLLSTTISVALSNI